jgi:Tfp pilus assembly major pilin PilA
MASNSEGISVSPYLLTVVESSIKLESSVTSVTATIGLPYYITYKVTNKVLGSATSLIVKNETNGISKTYDMRSFSSVEPKLLDVNFFDLFGGQTPTAGSSYTISAQATTSIDTTVIYSDTVTNRVVVEDGTSLVVLVDGITTKQDVDAGSEPTEFAQSGNISFSFTPYLAGASIIYYAIRI